MSRCADVRGEGHERKESNVMRDACPSCNVKGTKVITEFLFDIEYSPASRNEMTLGLASAAFFCSY
jgi:hypothetical protein